MGQKIQRCKVLSSVLVCEGCVCLSVFVWVCVCGGLCVCVGGVCVGGVVVGVCVCVCVSVRLFVCVFVWECVLVFVTECVWKM